MALIIALVVGVSLSMFLGSAAINEKAKFALVFAGSSIRLAGVLGLVLFTVFFIRRSFDARDVEFILSRPVSRTEFILSYAAGLSLLALILTAAQAFCLFMTAPYLFGQGHLIWVITVGLENIIMVNTALFFSMVLSSAPSAAMATAGFYVLGRLMGQILGIIDAFHQYKFTYQIMEYAMQGISALMPRLDLFGQTSWLVYDVVEDVDRIVIQGSIFVVLVVAASLIDLVRKQF
jgi:hypothetical protein